MCNVHYSNSNSNPFLYISFSFLILIYWIIIIIHHLIFNQHFPQIQWIYTQVKSPSQNTSLGTPYWQIIFAHSCNKFVMTGISNKCWQLPITSFQDFRAYGMCWKIWCPKVCIDYAAISLYFYTCHLWCHSAFISDCMSGN